MSLLRLAETVYQRMAVEGFFTCKIRFIPIIKILCACYFCNIIYSGLVLSPVMLGSCRRLLQVIAALILMPLPADVCEDAVKDAPSPAHVGSLDVLPGCLLWPDSAPAIVPVLVVNEQTQILSHLCYSLFQIMKTS